MSETFNEVKGIFEKEQDESVLLARGGSTSLIGLILSKGLTFLTELILARLLGVTNYGLLSLGRTVIQTPNFAADIGMRHGIVKYGAMYWIENKKDSQKGVLLGSLQVTVGVSLLLSLVIFLSAQWLANWFNEPRLETILKILSWMLLPSAVSMVIASYARAQMKFGIDVFLRILARQIIIFLLSLILVGWARGGVLSATYVLLFAAIINALIAMFVVIQRFLPPLKHTKSTYDLREWIRFSIPLFFVDIAYLMLKNTSRILLGYFGQIESVGIFTVASTLGENLIFFLIAFNPILAPIIVAYHSTGDQEQLIQNYRTIGRWQLLLTLPFAIVMMVYPKEVMLLFGADFQTSGTVLIFIVLAQCAYVATGPSGIVLQMTGHHDVELINSLVAFIVNLVSGLVLIPKYGLTGASISTACALIFLQVCRIVEIYTLLKFFPYDLAFYKGMFAGIVSLLCSGLIKQFIVFETNLSNLILGVFITFLSFLIMLFLLKLEKSDVELIYKIGHKIKKEFGKISKSNAA